MNKRTPLFAPVYVVKLCPQFGDDVHGLRRFLKVALRSFSLRCVSIRTEQLEIPSPRPSRQPRRRSRVGNYQEIVMDKADAERLKTYAASTRAHLGFGGATFISFDWKTGKYTIGKAKTDFTGQKLVANLPNTMAGFRDWPAGGKPEYALTLVLDPNVEPIQRDELGKTDKKLWADEKKDPWVPVTALVLHPEDMPRQAFVLIASYSERSEAGNVIDAYVDHNRDRAKADEEVPVIQLCARSYHKQDGTEAFAMQLDVVGPWVPLAETALKISPPALKIAAVEPVAAKAVTNGKSASEAADASKAADDKPTKPKRKVSIAGKSDYDDEVPF
jgi:hypothetical protein